MQQRESLGKIKKKKKTEWNESWPTMVNGFSMAIIEA